MRTPIFWQPYRETGYGVCLPHKRPPVMLAGRLNRVGLASSLFHAGIEQPAALCPVKERHGVTVHFMIILPDFDAIHL